MYLPQGLDGFDIVGDIHGCASELEQLLKNMGYEETHQGFHYPDHKRFVIFLGDLVDRGPEIAETVKLVKKMTDNGSAMVIMGNHELNAIAYHTPHGDGFLRSRTARSTEQIEATLTQLSDADIQIEHVLDWFKTFPLFVEHQDFRVVHACWDEVMIKRYLNEVGSAMVPDDVLMACKDSNGFYARCVERLTRGISLRLPKNRVLKGYDGYLRNNFRVGFWYEAPETYAEVVFQPDPLPDDVAYNCISAEDREKMIYYPPEEKPLFLGHYWLSGEPELVQKNIACLDYSAVNGGKLVAYRYSRGEKQLSTNNFVFVQSNK